MSSDIAVVGMSAVFPKSPDLLTYWTNIVNGRDAITLIPDDRWLNHPPGETVDLAGIEAPARGGFIETEFEFDAFRHGVLPSSVKNAGPEQFIMLEIVSRALDDAQIAEDDPRRATTDLFVGQGGFGNAPQGRILHGTEIMPVISSLVADTDRELQEILRNSLPDMNPSEVETAVPNFTANATAKRLNLQGVAYTLDAACASSLVTVELGVDRLRNGRCDIAVAAGGHFAQNPTFWYIMASLGALSNSGQIRPFDRSASGLVPGEGAGAVVLKRLDDAVDDGDEIYAVVKGTGSSSDGRGKGLFAPSASGQKLALERAYADADCSPDSIGLLEAHGTATPIGDAAEAETIRIVYGERDAAVPSRAMGSVKSMIGHTMPAAGVAGFIKATLALTHKVLPPSLHCTEPIEALDDLPFYVNSDARPWVHRAFGTPRRAAVNAFGFGGVNGHIVLEEVPEPKEVARADAAPRPLPPEVRAARPRPVQTVVERPTETLFFSGETPAHVATELDRAAAVADQVGLEALAQTLARRADSAADVRLTLACDLGQELGSRLETLAAEIRSADAPTPGDSAVSWAVGQPPTRGTSLIFGGSRLAFELEASDFVFERALHVPATLEALDNLQPSNDVAHRPVPWHIELSAPSSFPDEVRARLFEEIQARNDVDLGDLMMWCANNRVRSIVQFGGWLAVKDLGLDIEAVLTVSLGEYLALALCLDVDPNRMMDRLWEVGVEYDGVLTGGTLFVSASEADLEPMLRDRPDVEIALHMAPTMQLLGGPHEPLQEIQEEVSAKGWLNWLNDIPPVHTEMLTDASAQFGAALAEFETATESRFPVYSSCVPGRLPDDPAEIVRLIGMSSRRPAKIWQMLEIAVEDGVRNVIECGPGAHYSVFWSVAADRAQVALPTDDVLRHPITQIQKIVADLFIAGATVDPEALFNARPEQSVELDPTVEAEAPERPKVAVSLTWAPVGVAGGVEQPSTPAAAVYARSNIMPLRGTVLHEDSGAVTNTLTFDLDVDLYEQSHCLIPDDGRPVGDRFPVVPGSFVVEAMAESAALVIADRGLIEIADIRYEHWFQPDADGRLTVEFRATPATPDSVTVEAFVDFRRHATATARFGETFLPPRELTWSEPTNAHEFPGTVAELYTPGELFHGPLLQVIEAIDYRSDSTVAGWMRVADHDTLFSIDGDITMITDPVAVDAAAHLIGAWVFGVDIAGFPTSIDSIGLHGPRPAPGTLVPCRMEILEFSTQDFRLRAQMEVGDGNGGQWLTIVGFVDWIFVEPQTVSEYRKTAAPGLLANRLELPGLPPGVLVAAAPTPKFNALQLQLLERSFLGADERAEALPRGRRVNRLSGRIAAKEALMLDPRNTAHVWEIKVGQAATGAPAFEANGHWVPAHLSLSHTDWGAAAATADEPVGIDIESSDVTAAADAFDFVAPDELELLRSVFAGLDEARLLRAGWCAKEATSKAVGTGLQGRPARWQLRGADELGRLICFDTEAAAEYRVCLGELDAATIAVAFPAPAPAPAPA